MKTSVLLAVVAAVFASEGALAASQIFERIHTPPRHFTQLNDVVPSSQHIQLTIHVPQQNVAQFEKHLIDISTPEHAQYGEHMSQAEIDKMLAPKASSIVAVKRWLDRTGCGKTATVDRDTVKVTLSVKDAEKLLGAKYSYFQDEKSGSKVLRTMAYSLPQELKEHIDFVQPTTAFPFRSKIDGHLFGCGRDFRLPHHQVPQVQHSNSKRSAIYERAGGGFSSKLDLSCNHTITPGCLAALYNFADYKPQCNSVIGITGYLGEHAKYNDLAQFLDKYAPHKSGKQSLLGSVNINGGNNSQIAEPDNSGEANLDVQYTVSISSPIKNVYYSTGGSPPFIPDADTTENSNEPYLEFLEYLLRLPQSKLPATITTSYGDMEQTVPKSYAVKVCNMMGQLGARGVSMLFASGDEGPGNSCVSNDGKNTTRFIPEFPTSCPWVTATGGVYHILPEKAISFSGGGFSDYFKQPSYQKTAVSAYLKDHPETWKQFEQYFDKTGRAYPDVSAQSNNFTTFVNTTEGLTAGTSASTPAFAGVVALLNSERIRQGRRPLGFLNPWLYSDCVKRNKGLTDIVDGTSKGCRGPSNDTEDGSNSKAHLIPNAGWAAVKGWDASTGLGTPNFEGLKKAL